MAKQKYFEIRIVQTDNGLAFEYDSKPSSSKIQTTGKVPECVAFGLQAAAFIEKLYHASHKVSQSIEPEAPSC